MRARGHVAFGGRLGGVINPCLWFDGQAEAAAEFYVSLFPNSSSSVGARNQDGSALTVDLVLDGQRFMLLNGGPQFTFTEAVSFMVPATDQADADRYWAAFTSDGGEEGMCGWCKDRFGLSWQVIPAGFYELVSDPDPARAQRAQAAMMQMRRLDVAALRAAADAV